MRILLPVVAALAGLLPLHSGGQMGGMDMAVAHEWSEAKVVRYHAEGVHKARAAVVYGNYEGKADVADRRSFSMKGAENWVWTYTPTLVR